VSGEWVDPLDRAAALLLGADDYIVKPFGQDEFLARIRRLLARTARAGRGAKADAAVSALTTREQEVLRLLASGLSQMEIAGRLVISPKTVATHIQNVLTKLGVHSRDSSFGHVGSFGPPRRLSAATQIGPSREPDEASP
jgi:DNA-binding NarL/FixJ family response regulator